MNFGAPELIIVLLVVVLLFGGAKLPQLARSLGQAKKEFQEGAAEQPGGGAPSASAERPLRKKPSDT